MNTHAYGINAYAYGLPCIFVRYSKPVPANVVMRLNLSAGHTLAGAIVEMNIFENTTRTRIPLSALSFIAPDGEV